MRFFCLHWLLFKIAGPNQVHTQSSFPSQTCFFSCNNHVRVFPCDRPRTTGHMVKMYHVSFWPHLIDLVTHLPP